MTDKQKHVSELIDKAVLADLDLGTLAGLRQVPAPEEAQEIRSAT